MSYVTEQSRELFELREKHRRLLSGVPDGWFQEQQPLDPPLSLDQIERRESELALRRMVDDQLDSEVLEALEAAIKADALADARSVVRSLRLNRNLTRGADLIEVQLDPEVRDARARVKRVDQLGDDSRERYVRFVVSAVVADVLAGDYIDPRVGRASVEN